MRASEERATRLLLGSLEWVEVDDALAERAGALANQFLPSHPGVDPVDYVIVATVECLDAELWTRNLKHFNVPRPQGSILTLLHRALEPAPLPPCAQPGHAWYETGWMGTRRDQCESPGVLIHLGAGSP